MKRPTLRTIILMVVLCTALSAQSINGTWQGTLPISDNPRVAFKLAKADDGSLQGVFYQIDKSSSGIALTSVTFTPPDLSVKQVNADISYRGKLSADGKSIAGTWTQDKHSYPLTLILATPDTLWKRNDPAMLAPMSPTADPAFEVAAIRLTPPDTKASSYGLKTRDFTAKNRSVRDMIEFSYKLSHRQVSGGPSWMDDTKFDIAARPDTEGLPSNDQYRLMIRKLLASRFQLQTHTVKQTFPVYALTRDAKAPKLPHGGPEFDGVSSCYVKKLPEGQTELHCVGMAMPQFADALMSFITDRQIVDETGLAGYFEFTMLVTTSDLHSKEPGDWADATMRALQPLGFKLVPKRKPLDVIVVDHLEKPSPN
jgi:uncharacterized protein (TIGR03435 family)